MSIVTSDSYVHLKKAKHKQMLDNVHMFTDHFFLFRLISKKRIIHSRCHAHHRHQLHRCVDHLKKTNNKRENK